MDPPPTVGVIAAPAAMLLVALVAGCIGPGSDNPTQGQAWVPLECDPEQVDWIGGGARVLPFWNQTPEQMAATFAEAAGHTLGIHRSSAPTVHQWALHDANDTYLGQLELRRIGVVGAAEEWRLMSEAGLPPGGVAWARELIHALAGPVAMHERVLEDEGILQVDLYQAHDAYRIIDAATLDAGLGGYRLHNNASALWLRPWYDLSNTTVAVDAQTAIERATAYFACQRDMETHVVGWEMSVVHGTLAYAVDLRDANANSWLCVPPILVDTASGAVLGSASIDVCALPE